MVVETRLSPTVYAQVLRVHEYKETRLLFRGWSRLHLHAAFHKAAEAASAAATANARATRAKLTEQKAVIAVSSTDAAEQETAGEHTIREQSVVRRRAKHTVSSFFFQALRIL